MTGKTLILALATTATGLIAGLLYAYSVSVNPAFAQLPDREYIAAMQAINVAIQNPWFGLSFGGAALLLPLAAALHRQSARRFRLLLAAAACYLLGGVGITLAANVPLNEALATVALRTAPAAELAAARTRFAGPWNRWHAVRTGASVVALLLAAGACVAEPGPRPE